MSETKKLHVLGSLQGIGTGLNYNRTALSPFMPFENGLLHNQVIGTEIDVRYFEIRYRLFRSSTTNSNLGEPTVVKFTLIKTPRIWTLGTPTLPFIPDANIPTNATIGGGSPAFLNAKWNSNVVKVLASKTVRLPAGYNSSSNFKYGRVRFRQLRGKKNFMVGNSTDVEIALGEVRQGQYYIVMEMYQSIPSGTSHNTQMHYDWSMYYKDM